MAEQAPQGSCQHQAWQSSRRTCKTLWGTWCDSRGHPVQGQKLDFSDLCGSLPTQVFLLLIAFQLTHLSYSQGPFWGKSTRFLFLFYKATRGCRQPPSPGARVAPSPGAATASRRAEPPGQPRRVKRHRFSTLDSTRAGAAPGAADCGPWAPGAEGITLSARSWWVPCYSPFLPLTAGTRAVGILGSNLHESPVDQIR